jgi:hypothetical protein
MKYDQMSRNLLRKFKSITSSLPDCRGNNILRRDLGGYGLGQIDMLKVLLIVPFPALHVKVSEYWERSG